MTARRKLGLFDATMLVMGGIIGVGIFFTPGSVAELVPIPWQFLAIWALGAAVAMCGAATFAELGGTFPRYGGWFEFLREIYGPFVSFLFAWVILGVVVTGAIAAIAAFGAEVLLGLFGVESGAAQLATGAAIILGLTGISLCGVKVGATVQNLCMITKLVAIAALTVGGIAFLAPEPVASTATTPAQVFEPSWRGLVAASLPVFFAFGGWQHVCYIADEVKDPQRTVPKAILLGVLGVGLTYVAINYSFLLTLGTHGLATTDDFAAVAARKAFGGSGEQALRAAMAVSAIGVCAVNVIANPAIFVAMARNGLFFKSFGEQHARTGAPILALIAQAAIALVYLVWQHFADMSALIGSVVFAEWIFHGLVAYGLIRLRRMRPELPRPYRSFAFPLAPVLYLVTAFLVVGGNLASSPGVHAAIGLSVLAVGALVYKPWRLGVLRSG